MKKLISALFLFIPAIGYSLIVGTQEYESSRVISLRHGCGASYISEYALLTSAHCLNCDSAIVPGCSKAKEASSHRNREKYPNHHIHPKWPRKKNSTEIDLAALCVGEELKASHYYERASNAPRDMGTLTYLGYGGDHTNAFVEFFWGRQLFKGIAYHMEDAATAVIQTVCNPAGRPFTLDPKGKHRNAYIRWKNNIGFLLENEAYFQVVDDRVDFPYYQRIYIDDEGLFEDQVCTEEGDSGGPVIDEQLKLAGVISGMLGISSMVMNPEDFAETAVQINRATPVYTQENYEFIEKAISECERPYIRP